MGQDIGSRLLIISCAKSKRTDDALLPAITRYDGPAYRVLRRYQQTSKSEALDIYIVSARFGLLSATSPIPYYDQVMTQQRACELRQETEPALRDILGARRYQDVFVFLGRNYSEAVGDYMDHLGQSQVMHATGTMGKRLFQLRAWLYQERPGYQSRVGLVKKKEPVVVRGTTVYTDRHELRAVVRKGIALGTPDAVRCHVWYALVDGHRISPKWLLSQVTGLPVGSFHTHDAIRALQAVGIEIEAL